MLYNISQLPTDLYMASEVSQQVSSSSSAFSPPDIIDIPETDDALNSDLQISPDNLDVGVKEPLQHPSDTLDVKDMPLISPLHDVVSTSTFAVPDNQIFLDICAGSTWPLSEAILSLGGDVVSFDIWLDSSMDSLRDDSNEQVLRICSSAQVRIRFSFTSLCPLFQVETVTWTRSQGSPHTGGIAGRSGLSSQELLQVQESYLMLFRCITCLTLIFQVGGHVHLEQPPSAMSWLEDCVVQFLTLISAWCVVMAACAYDADWPMLLGNMPFVDSRILPILVVYPESIDESLVGDRKGPPGQKESSHLWIGVCRTGMFRTPSKSFVKVGFKKFEVAIGQTNVGIFFSLGTSRPTIPRGGGAGFSTDVDCFCLRAIREHQHMHLQILRSCQLMKDADTALFSSLLEGVVTGFCHNIPPSKCMPPNECDINLEVPLSAHYSNWNSADSDLVLTKSLVQEEIDKGWVFEFEGTIEEAQARWPLGVSLGKLGIAHSDGRAPRLCWTSQCAD